MQCFWQYRDHNGVRCRARLVLPAHNTIHHVKLRPELGISPQRWSFQVSLWKALPRLECLVWLLDCIMLLPDLICCEASMHCGQGCMECSMSGPLIHDSASAFPLVDPFLYMISKQNTCIARVQRYSRPSIFCSPSHCRGAWSVISWKADHAPCSGWVSRRWKAYLILSPQTYFAGSIMVLASLSNCGYARTGASVRLAFSL